ncbi:PDZ domain-containing protein [Stenotrophomonas maltophilia]|uniref:PDZ domain-containing protein n=1 Tax=Stenotrophomonas maltophilia TaxID=40324 RepID=UPI0028947329|nr:PDZ domain-containing protein [Stenotrophomonas maltophilia]MDT3502649.1 PDZ domain-containing protein [Stenotrophomonas maltophilia]
MRAPFLAMMLMLPLPVLAGSSSSQQTMSWQDDGAHVALASSRGQVRVDAAHPEARFGVRRGDRILRVDDTAVQQIDQLTAAMQATGASSVRLLLQRDGKTLTVPVSLAGWRPLLSPPAAPPPPPAPPPPRR